MPDAYLDHAATTPLRPEARAAMEPLLGRVFGNPSGSHRFAREARRLLDDARDTVAHLLGAHPSDVVFTSGGTEAADLAIRGVTDARGGIPICSAVEHHAVLAPVEAAGGSTVPVDSDGRVDLDALTAALRQSDRPISVVSVMAANNETGSINDLHEVAEAVARTGGGVPLHTDAVAAAAWQDLSVTAAAASLVSISGHKIGAPKGIGALVVRGGVALNARLLGGGQERERRSGTPNVAGAVALAAALEAVHAARVAEDARTEALRRRLVDGLTGAVPDLHVVSPGDRSRRTPGTVQVCVPGVDREALLFLLDEAGVAASWGASCASGASEPSHVLAAMGISPDLARGALRLSMGWTTTESDVDAVLAVVPAAVERLRGGSEEPTPLRDDALSEAVR